MLLQEVCQCQCDHLSHSVNIFPQIDELTTVLRALAKVKYQNDEQLEEYVRQTVDALIEKCDTDKNGEISKEGALIHLLRKYNT